MLYNWRAIIGVIAPTNRSGNRDRFSQICTGRSCSSDKQNSVFRESDTGRIKRNGCMSGRFCKNF